MLLQRARENLEKNIFILLFLEKMLVKYRKIFYLLVKHSQPKRFFLKKMLFSFILSNANREISVGCLKFRRTTSVLQYYYNDVSKTSSHKDTLYMESYGVKYIFQSSLESYF